MYKLHGHGIKQQDYILELYEMLKRNFPLDKISDWMAIKGIRHTAQMVRNTFKKAGREDLMHDFIQEEDIKIGDTIRSRSTARFGKVIGIHKDDFVIEVRWASGGTQLLSKASVFKMREGEINSTKDFKIPKTITDDYGDINKKS
jgi:hypothetical protein